MDFDFSTETITPDQTSVLTIGGSGGLILPSGTTADRPPSPTNGTQRYNTDVSAMEMYVNGTWTSIVEGVDFEALSALVSNVNSAVIANSAQMTSADNFNSNNISIVSAAVQALSVIVSNVNSAVIANSAQMTSADNAISNAVSVLSTVVSNVRSAVIANSAQMTSADNAISNAVSVVSADLASVRSNLQSNINAVSNALSVLSNANSADHVSIRNLISIVSAQVATNSAQMTSADNAISNAVSVVSADLASVRSNLQSNINAVSNSLSVLSNTNSAEHLSINNRISALSALTSGSIVVVRCASTGDVTIATPGATMDSTALASGDRVLLWQQTTAADNGIYIFNGAASPLTRSSDMSTSWDTQVAGRAVLVTEGALYQQFTFINTNTVGGTIGTTAMTWGGEYRAIGPWAFGNQYTSARSSTGFGPRVFTLIDTNAVFRVWRFTSSGSNPGVEFIYGTNDDAASSANDWWDITLNESPNAGVRIANRTGGITNLKLFASITGVRIGPNVAETNPAVGLEINATDAVLVPVGTTAQQPTGVVGYIRYNSSNTVFEGFNGAWRNFATDQDISNLQSNINAVSNSLSIQQGSISNLSSAIQSNSAQMTSADAALSNRISVLSAIVSNQGSAIVANSANNNSARAALSNRISVLSAIVSNQGSAIVANSAQMTSANNAISAQVASVNSNLVSLRSVVQANSAQMTSANNAISNAVSVVSAAVQTLSAIVSNVQSNVAALSNSISAISNLVSVASAAAQVASAAASVASAAAVNAVSAANVASNAASVASAAAVNATSAALNLNSAFTLGGNQTVSATAVVSVSGMSFSLLSNATYKFQFFIFFSAALSATAPQFALSAPAIANMAIQYNDSNAAGAVAFYSVVLNTQGTKMTGYTTMTTPGTQHCMQIFGQVVTSSTSGNLVLNVGNSVSGSSTSIIIIKSGSFGNVQRLI